MDHRGSPPDRSRALRVAGQGLRALAVVSAVAVGVVAIGLLWLTTEAGNDWLRRQLVTRGGAMVDGGSLQIEGLRTNLVSDLALDGIVLRGPEGHVLVGMRRVALSYELWPLLRRELELDDVEIDGLEVALGIDGAGTVDLFTVLGIGSSPGPAEPWKGVNGRISVRHLGLTGGRVAVATLDQRVVVDDLSFDAGVQVDGNRVVVEGLRVDAVLREPSEMPLALTGGVALVAGDLRLDNIVLDAGQSRLRLAGLVRRVETAPELDVALWATPLAAEDVQPWIGEQTLASDIRATLALRGPSDALRFDGEVESDCGGLVARGQAAILATPPTWTVEVVTPGLALDQCLPTIGGDVRLAGRYRADGRGLVWPDDLTVRIDVDGGDQTFYGEAVDGLTLRGELAGGVLRVTSADAQLQVGHAALRGAIDVDAATASLDGDVEVPDLRALRRYGLDGVSGGATYRGGIEVDWSADDLRVGLTGAVSGRRLSAFGVRAAALAGPVEVAVRGAAYDARGESQLTGVVVDGVDVAGGTASWSARSQEGGTAFEASAVIAGLAADPGVSVDRIAGEVSGTQDADGRLVVTGRADLVGVGTDPRLGLVLPPLDGGPLAFRLDGDALFLDLDLRRADAPGLRLLGTGDLAENQWQIEEAVLAISPDLRISTSAAHFRLADDGLRQTDLVIDGFRRTTDGRAVGQGRVAITGDLVAERPTASVAFDALSVPFLVAMATLLPPGDPAAEPLDPSAWGGQLDGRAGAWEAAEGVSVSLDLTGGALVLPGVTRPLDLHLEADGPAHRPLVELTVHDGGELRLATQGEIALTGTGLDCHGASIARLLVPPVDTRILGSLLGVEDLQPGEIALDLRAKGSACNPDLELVASGRSPMGSAGEELRIDLSLQRVGRSLWIDGGVEEALARRGRFSGTAVTGMGDVFAAFVSPSEIAGEPQPDLRSLQTWASAVELDVIPLALPISAVARFVSVPADVDGRLAGGLHLSGELLRPAVSGGLVVVDARMGTVALPMAFLGITPFEGGQRLDGQLAFADSGGLVVSADLPDVAAIAETSGPVALHLTVAGEGIPLAALASLTDEVDGASGLLVVEGSIGGTLQQPVPDLQATIAHGSFAWVPGGIRVSDLEAAVRIEGGVLYVDRLDMADRRAFAPLQTGRLSLNGTAVLDGAMLRSVDLAATMDKFWLTASRTATTALSGDLRAVGTWPTVAVSGELALAEGRFELGEQFFLDQSSLRLDPAITVRRPGGVTIVSATAASPPFWEAFDLDVQLDLRRSLHLVADIPTYERLGRELSALSRLDIDGDFDGVLQVKQQGSSGGALVLQGEVETLRGTATVLGAPFQLGEGRLHFLGDSYDNPTLDLWAVRHAGAYGDVTVHITGNVDQTRLDFESDRTKDQTDIVSLLLFGVPASDIAESQSGTLMTAALASVSGQLGRAVDNRVIDQFSIDPAATSLRLGKAMSDKLFLSTELKAPTAADDNHLEVTIEWLITRRMYAEFVAGDQGQGAADLYWRWRF